MIGVFDSGIGGLRLLDQLRQRWGQEDFIYLADQAHVPYGSLDRDTLLESAERYGKSPYGKHLKDVAEGKVVIVPND